MRLQPIKANMTVLVFNDGSSVLFSYETPVAACKDYQFYKTKTMYSKTTTRHINQWLDGCSAIEQDQKFFNNLVKGV
jgi:hypothetical protein